MMSLKIIVLLIFSTSSSYGARIASFPVGGLFNNFSQRSSLEAFKNKVQLSGTRAYHGRFLDSKVVDSYSTALELCPFTSDNKGIVALIDVRPTWGICDTICLLCNRYNISHLSIAWEPTTTLAQDLYTFIYYPPLEVMSKAYTALIKELQWDKFTLFYEDEGSFLRLQDVINSWSNIQEPIIYRKLDPNGDNREIFKHIFKVEHMSYHIIDCDIANTKRYFAQITDVENSTEYQSFILSNLDSYKLNFEDMQEVMANISTFHLTAASEDKWTDIKMDPESHIPLETALTADALNHVERAINKMILDSQRDNSLLSDLPEPPALCYQNSKADYEELALPTGAVLRDALINITANGFTGDIEFDENRKRINFKLYYSKLNKESRFIYAGKWDSRTNKLITENEVMDRSTASKSHSKIRIAIKQGLPYFNVTESENGTVFRGYGVDLVVKIFNKIKEKKHLDYQYEFYRVSGDEYGSPVAGSRKWNGIIGDLMEHKADLGVCDLTITSERNAVVDFSIPFMTLGISMLMSKPAPEEPHMFSFLLPLSLDVWLYLATTYIIVSFILLICARMSQEDWVNPHPCNQNPENCQNIWSLYNCMWFTMGSIMCQGCDILPRAVGSRWVAGMWWFFALIVTSSYTANMSTFLSDSRRSTEINDVKSLADQNKISYGAVYNASTYRFFENSNETLYQKLWSVMQSSKPTVFTKSNDEGTDRVNRSKGSYVFFMESTAIEYVTKRNCDLKMVGGKLDSKEYGIALPKNSPLKNLLDFAILSLQESGKLEELKKKWWEEEDNAASCSDDVSVEEDTGSVQMKNTSGIFLVLGVGGILGLIVAIINFLLNARQISVKEKVTFKEAFMSEWRASLNPKNLHRLAAPPRSEPPSTATPSPDRDRSMSRAVSVLRAASSFINFDKAY